MFVDGLNPFDIHLFYSKKCYNYPDLIKKDLNLDLSKYTEEELVDLYSRVIKELKVKKIIRTKNVLGDLGEYLTINYYCKNTKLPNLSAAPVGTENIDAIDRKGCRYSIKSSSNNQTGVFFGLNDKDSCIPDEPRFEYVVICHFNDDYCMKAIYQMDWKTFVKHKKWHSRMKAWNLQITKELIDDCNIIYKKDSESL